MNISRLQTGILFHHSYLAVTDTGDGRASRMQGITDTTISLTTRSIFHSSGWYNWQRKEFKVETDVLWRYLSTSTLVRFPHDSFFFINTIHIGPFPGSFVYIVPSLGFGTSAIAISLSGERTLNLGSAERKCSPRTCKFPQTHHTWTFFYQYYVATNAFTTGNNTQRMPQWPHRTHCITPMKVCFRYVQVIPMWLGTLQF